MSVIFSSVCSLPSDAPGVTFSHMATSREPATTSNGSVDSSSGVTLKANMGRKPFLSGKCDAADDGARHRCDGGVVDVGAADIGGQYRRRRGLPVVRRAQRDQLR